MKRKDHVKGASVKVAGGNIPANSTFAVFETIGQFGMTALNSVVGNKSSTDAAPTNGGSVGGVQIDRPLGYRRKSFTSAYVSVALRRMYSKTAEAAMHEIPWNANPTFSPRLSFPRHSTPTKLTTFFISIRSYASGYGHYAMSPDRLPMYFFDAIG